MFKRKIAALALSTLLVFTLSACGSSASSASQAGSIAAANNTSQTVSEADPQAGWPAELVIVQMPNEANPDAGSTHDGFRKALEDYIGIPVKEMEGSDYAVGIEAMKSGKLDIMLVSPMSFFQAKQVAGAEPFVTTEVFNAAPYKTVFITKADRDDITTLEDLKGKTFAFVDPASSSGYLYPKAELVKKLELDPEQLETPGYFFQTVAYSGKHDASLMGVAMGDYDAAAVAYQTLTAMIDAGLIKDGDLKIIDETPVIPNPCFVIRGDIPQTLKDKLKEFYLGYDNAEYFTMFYSSPDARFVEAKESDYEIVRDMLALLNIEG